MAALRAFARIVLIVTLALIGATAFLVSTQAGLNAMLATAQRLLPGQLSYQRIQGRLLGPLLVEGLRYGDGELQVEVDHAELRWLPQALLQRKVHVQTLRSAGIRVHFPAASPPTQPEQPWVLPELELPLELAIDALDLENIAIIPNPPAQAIALDRIQLRAHSTPAHAVEIQALALQLPQAQLQAKGVLTPRGAYPLALELDWHVQHPRLGEIVGHGKLAGELGGQLVLNHDLQGPLSAKVNATVRSVLNHPTWSSALEVNITDLGRFTPDLAGTPLHATLDLRGDAGSLQAGGAVDAEVPQLGPVRAELDMSASLTALKIRKLQVRASKSTLSLDTVADIDIPNQTVSANGEWRDLGWPLGAANPRIRSANGKLAVNGTLQDYHIALDGTVAGDEFGTFNVSLAGSGAQQSIRIEHLDLQAPTGNRRLTLTGAVEFATQSGDLKANWQDLAWPLVGAAQIQSPRGELTVSGKRQDFRARLEAQLAGPQLGEGFAAVAQADGGDNKIRLSELALRSANGKRYVRAQGKLDLADLGFDIAGEWQGMAWPLSGAPQVESPRGKFNANGNLRDFGFTLDTAVQGANLPSGDWRLQGRGNRQAIESLRLEGDILKGQVRANAKLSLPPNLAWQAELSGADLDPAAQWRDLSGKIAVKLSSQGKLDQGALQASIKLEQLSGTLSGQAIQGQGEVALANREISIDKLRISAGKAYLQANGKLDGVWALTWQLEVPNLKGLLPNARGSLNGSGSLAGSRNQPRADLKLAASQFAIGATAIAKLQADANVDVSGETTSRIRVDGSDLRIGGQDWNSMSIQAAGTPRQHTATAALGGALGKIDLALSGALESDNTWRGRLNRFSARATQAGDWVLEKPMALTVSAREARAENACIASKPSQICAQGQWRAGQGGSAKLALTQLDTARFRQWLPAQFSLANSVNGQASGTLAPDGTVQGALDAKISPGKVRFSNQGLPAEIDLRAGNLHAEASGRDLRADFKLDLGNIGQLAGSAQIKDFLKEPLINGNLKADIGDLKWVSMFAPQAQGVAGHLRADLDISGSPAALSLSGNADLSGGAAEIPRLGMQLKAIQLRATGAGKGILRFDGSARSGNGALTLTGQWDPTRNQLDLALRGKDFQAANTAQLQAVIGTDLHLSLAQGKARLEGEVDVPKAFIKPAGGAAGGRVEPSSDVVIVDGASGKTAKATALAIDAKVRISLGEDVRIETRGFKGKLRGAVLVEQTPRLAPRGNGQVEVVAGDYKIYGQFLTIERGRLLFSGGPIDNPGLDLRVSRKFNDVTAGAQVRGSLKNPQLQLFSQPAMADTSVLSYLVLGRAPSALSGSENALLLQAASALGGGDRLSEGVANALGLDDLAVNTGAGGADASVAFGKYLSPDLYVSYGIGLFDAVNTFKLRYRFGKHLNFEAASSGKQSSADVLYSIER